MASENAVTRMSGAEALTRRDTMRLSSSISTSGGANKPSGPRESYDLNEDIPF